jgi:amino acid adenylation domain-containing protein
VSTASAAEGIAIVGIAGRFPGSRNVAEFWRHLVAGDDLLTRFSREQLAAAGHDAVALAAVPEYVPVRGVVEKPEWFDRAFFGIAPKEAEVMDPQHRVFLETAWEALEDAGCDPARYAGLVGVYAGMSTNTYYPYFVRQRPDLLAAVGVANAVIANEKDFLATRLAYKLNLRGPALNIQAACSSSLVAVAVACQQLLEHQCDAALAGGVSLTFPQERGYFFQEGGMTSPDGRCRPFHAEANGTVFSSGAGVVVLKRLADALAEGDQVYAVIRGQALNNDGSQKVSFAAPSIDGQAEVIALAQAVAGFSPESISYVEAHGTGTPLGDPVEIEGLTQVFRAATDRRGVCALGTVKGNIGHLDAASGVAGLIKTALAFRNEKLPPTINSDTPNPALNLAESPFYLNTTLRDWKRGPEPRRAGISSFGVGGTNVHLVLEEAPERESESIAGGPQVIVLSAKTASALEQRAQDLAAHLEANPTEPLRHVAFTLQQGRQMFAHRRAVVAKDADGAAAALRAPSRLQREDERVQTPVAFLFPGQGSQYAGMGAALYRQQPVFRQALDRCAEILEPLIGVGLRERIFDTTDGAADRLRETHLTQPAIFAFSYALAQLWIRLGVQPAALAGHSVGEFVAATIAGVFSLEDAARVVAARAKLVQALPPGAMLAVRLGATDAQTFLNGSEATLAAANSPRLSVLSGTFEQIAVLEERCVEKGIAARRLETSHAFHSRMVEPVVEPLAELLRSIPLSAPAIPLVSTVTGEWLTPEDATDPAYWANHVRETVRFADAVGTLLAGDGYAVLEAGPGTTLTQLVRQHPARTARHETTSSISAEQADDESVALALAHLWLAGVPVAWPKLHGAAAQRVSLPTYPFERQRYFADLPPGTTMPLATAITDGEIPHGVTNAPAAPAQLAALAAPVPPTGGEIAVPVAPVAAPVVVEEEPVASQVKRVLEELSGTPVANAPDSTTLLDLGFDSLSLSQAAVTISRRFGAKIVFRQLMRELGTVGALTEYVEKNATAKVSPVIRTAPAAPGSAPAPAPATGAHGPFRPVQRELSAEFTDSQKRWLQDFIGRYVARTAKSKAHTEKYRLQLADPRNVAGFKQPWKEMVYPMVVGRSAGATLWDIDGNELVDITLSFGAAMFGHQPAFLTEAVKEQMELGFEVGPTSPLAGEVATQLCEISGHERVAFCNTGSEAILGALRVARTVTGRPKIAYFAGAYHGINDEVLGKRMPNGTAAPVAPGIPSEMLANALILEYGEASALAEIAANADDIAAVLVEPVQSRRPWLQPREFLHELRALTARLGIALIFDEVICGFRCHPGGAQAYFGVKADLATYGKVLGSGMPIGAVAGRAEYMDAFDGGAWRFGDDSFPGAAMTFFAGTFVRHPLALAAARAVLKRVKDDDGQLQTALTARTGALMRRINEAIDGAPYVARSFSSNWMFQFEPGFAYTSLLYALMRQRGIHVWEARPSFVSVAHTDAQLDRIVEAIVESTQELRDQGFIPPARGGPRRTSSFTVPIVESQQELWLLCQQTPMASVACNETWSLYLEGTLDLPALREAAATVVRRHDALRATVRKSGDLLDVNPAATLELPVIDLSHESAARAEGRLLALRETESERVFDLERGPLLTLQVVRLAPTRHVLLFNAHHIVSDGWSCDVFLTELSHLYSAYRGGREPALPPPFPLEEYQRWDSALRESPEVAEDTAYWLELYRQVPPLLDLPGDRPRPVRRSFGGADEVLIATSELPRKLQRLGSAHGATLFGVLLAGFEALLYRLTQQADFSVGVPSAGQSLAGADHLVGHCVNMLPLRAKVDGGQPFTKLLESVQGSVVDAFEHRRLTFGSLLRKLTLPRIPGRTPLIPVSFNLDPPLSEVRFEGLEHRLELNPRRAYQFDLGLNCDSTAEGLRIVCHYNTDIFNAETVRGWLNAYCELLNAAAENADLSVADLPFSTGPSALALKAEAPAIAQPETARPVMLWPSSPGSGGDQVYDDVLYNAMTVDKSRHDFFRRALVGVAEGKVAVDIGTGRDALLARMCLEAGARKVYGVELLEWAAQRSKELVERLGLQDRIVVTQGDALKATLPEPADFCIAENIGSVGGSEGGDMLLYSAHQRLLKPSGVVIPSRAFTMCAAVTLPREFLENPVFEPLGAHYIAEGWKHAGYSYDPRLCLVGANRSYLSSSEALFEDIACAQPTVKQYEREITLTIERDGPIDGFLLWVNLEATNGAALCTLDHPDDSWLPVYLPAFYPGLDVGKGDTIVATVSGELAPNGFNRDYHIRGRVNRAGGPAHEFAFESWHYKNVYRATPFYARLFRGDHIPVAGQEAPAEQSKTPLPAPSNSPVPAAWIGSETPFPADQGVHTLFEEQAARTPEATALDDGTQRLTYRELNDRAGRVSAALRARGVVPDENVGVCLERSVDFIVAILAVLKAGAAYLPLDPAYPRERLAVMIRDAKARVTLARSALECGSPLPLWTSEANRSASTSSPTPARTTTEDPAALHASKAAEDCRTPKPPVALEGAPTEVLDFATLLAAPATDSPAPHVTGASIAYVMFTSGSTGAPKGAEVRHRGISRLVLNTDYVQFSTTDVVAHASNICFDAATFEIWGALLNGARLTLLPKESLLSPSALAQEIAARGITVLFLTTPLFHSLAQAGPDIFGSLRYLVVGGDALSPEAARAVLTSARPPAHLVNGYGPTETTTFAICHHVAAVPEGASSIPIGKPIANTRVYLLDAQRAQVRPGERGEIHIGGPGVARGYASRRGLTAERFIPDPFSTDPEARLYCTGDLGRYLPDGTIEFAGRVDDQVKIRGFRVEPGEIELALQQHPLVGQCKVRAVPGAAAEKMLVGYVTPRNSHAPAEDDLRAFLSTRLPEFLVPAAFVVLPQLPLTPSGKIDIQALPAPALQVAARAAVEIADPLEREIAGFWTRILKRDHLSPTDDFFLSGGHSLLAIQLIGQLRDRFGVDVPVRQLFEAPTIRGLAGYISEHQPKPAEYVLQNGVQIQRGEKHRRPLFLVPGGWGGDIEFLVYAQLARQIDMALPVYGLRARFSDTDPLGFPSVETMAAAYVKEVRGVQPEGPYLLGGECVGGIIAYEMARQLEEAGAEVKLLLALDTAWPDKAHRRAFESHQRNEKWRGIWEWRVRQPAREHLEKLGRLSFAGKVDYVLRRVGRVIGRTAAPSEPKGPGERERITEYPRMAMNHVPAPYAGKVTLVIDEQAHAQYEALGWGSHHRGPLEIHVAPGDHVTYIREHAPSLAPKLRQLIEQAAPPALAGHGAAQRLTS